ncbi:hypothetical protein [Aliidiomarina iranensis]|uniref:hypothetical protein n=1 Tax=Aliidiomarina iranensis TaxID=1434071 RepID=UPI000F884CAF|nr:hypothetical protein [Aliidiomarina iranensis]
MILTVVAVFSLLGCSEVEQEPQRVSIHELMLYPERFHGKTVIVRAYSGIYSGRLYPYKKDSDDFIWRSPFPQLFEVLTKPYGTSPELDSARACRGQYVEITGLFYGIEHAISIWPSETKAISWNDGTVVLTEC